MIFKKILIFVLLFSSTWAGNDENDDELYSSDESDDGKFQSYKL